MNEHLSWSWYMTFWIKGQMILFLLMAVSKIEAAGPRNGPQPTTNPPVPTQRLTRHHHRAEATPSPTTNTASEPKIITSLPPRTNIDEDGLITATKRPTSTIKPGTKAVTNSPDMTTSFLSESAIDNLENIITTNIPSIINTTSRTIIPSSTRQLTSSNHLSSRSTQESTQRTSAISSAQTASVLSLTTGDIQTPAVPSMTPKPLTTPQGILPSTQPATSIQSSQHPHIHHTTSPPTTVSSQGSTSLFPHTTSPPPPHTTPSPPTSPASITRFTTTVFTTTRIPSTQRTFNSQTQRTSSVNTSIQPSQNQSVISTRPHQHTLPEKATKQSSGGHQGQSSRRPATARSGAPVEGGQNDQKGSDSDSVQPKDPHDINIPAIIPTAIEGTTFMDQLIIQPDLYPPIYIQLILLLKKSEFCDQLDEIHSSLDKVIQDILQSDVQTGLIGTEKICEDTGDSAADPGSEGFVTLEFYVTTLNEYDAETNQKVGMALQEDPNLLKKYLHVKVSDVYIRDNHAMLTPPPASEPVKGRATNMLGVEISVPLALVCLVVFGVVGFVLYKAYKLKLARQTYKDRYYFDGSELHDSMNDQDTQKLRPHENKLAARRNMLVPAINPAFEHDDELEEDDMTALQVFPSHILSVNALAKFYTYVEAIVQEFQALPNFQSVLRHTRKAPPSPLSPRRIAATLHAGHHLFEKHPFHHHHKILTPTRTEVKLQDSMFPVGEEPHDLHANLVQGYESQYVYIACPAPQAGADAFWQMIWEQQSKSIMLLCAPEEMGTRCVWYWPKEQGIQAAQLYGNILVMLQGQVKTDNYVISTLLIKDIQKNLCRPVTHCWFCQWPEIEIPINPRALIVYLLQVRQTYQENPGPVVVQCSDGFGRTGTVIAVDICMQSMENTYSVDIPSTVSHVRQDRGCAVLNREQYSFIYKVMYEYSTMLIASGDQDTNFDIHPPASAQSMPLRVMSQ